MQFDKNRILVITILGLLLGYQVLSAINRTTKEPYPYNDTEMGQIRPGFYKK